MSDKDKKIKQHLMDANAIFEREKIIAPISPMLDIALDKGILDGTFTCLAGPPGLGKTLLALSIVAEFQKPQYEINGPRTTYFYNIENRLKERDLKGIKGLDYSPERFKVIGSVEGAMLNAEQFLEIGESLLVEHPYSIHVFDSFSALCTEAEMTAGMADMQRADGAKLLYKFCRKIAQIVKVNRNLVIGINHIMGNPSGKGSETKEKGGYATQYFADIKLIGKYFEMIKDSKEEPIGQTIHWVTTKTAGGVPPGKKVTNIIRFGEGIDRAMEVAQLGVELSIITQKGAWYSYGERKWQGQEKMRDAIVNDQNLYDELLDKVKGMI